MSIGSVSSSSSSYYQDEMKSIDKDSISKIEADLSKENSAVQTAGNTDDDDSDDPYSVN